MALLLAEALKRVRISDSMQYCYVPSGDWETDATPAPYKPKDAVGFHILVAGSCWLDMAGRRTVLGAGDVAAFPFGTPHRIGAGAGGPEYDPGGALPPSPWPETPVVRFGTGDRVVRMLCGYVRCDALHFAPFREVLPEFIHVATSGPGDWLSAVVAQIVDEVDAPRRTGSAVLERLTEIVLLEVLRRQLETGVERSSGWLAAIHDPLVGRCLGLIHADPFADWTLGRLGREAGASRSVLAGRFASVLGRGPITYIREWRLFLARERLSEGQSSLAVVAATSGYGSEASFSRAFLRAYGVPPGAFRDKRPPSGSETAPPETHAGR